MRSITLRLALLAGSWVAIGLGAAGWFAVGVAGRGIDAAFDARLQALLDGAVGATALDQTGRYVVARVLEGADFHTPFSGAYWQVTGPGALIATSRSLWDQALPAAVGGHPGVLQRDAVGPRGERLRVLERDVLLPGAAEPIHVAVALSRHGTESEIESLRRVLGLAFVLIGAGLVAGIVVQVVLGLAPLRRARRALAEVRSGARDTLAIDAPSEIAPLVAEIDELIMQNRATVERARAHVGNLAHALKTPVAVLRNAVDASPPDIASARTEAAELERLVQHHLARARNAAVAAMAPEAPVLRIAGTIAAAQRRMHDLSIRTEGDDSARVRVDPQDLTEMLGNLVDNACNWATSAVLVSVLRDSADVLVVVEDDGPGLPEGSEAAVLARGGRLDEAMPGSGLGLAIVADLVSLHHGRLAFGRATAGGLRVELRLPGRLG